MRNRRDATWTVWRFYRTVRADFSRFRRLSVQFVIESQEGIGQKGGESGVYVVRGFGEEYGAGRGGREGIIVVEFDGSSVRVQSGLVVVVRRRKVKG